MPSACRAVRLSKMLKLQRMSFEDVLKCGSNFEMSPPWATTSSLFCVVCAWAEPGIAWGSELATLTAAAPFSNPRRVIFMRSSSLPKILSSKKRGDQLAAPVIVEAWALLRGPSRPPAEPGQPYQSRSQEKKARGLGCPMQVGKAAQNALGCDVVTFYRPEGEERGVDVDIRREARNGDRECRRTEQERIVRTITGNRRVCGRVVEGVARIRPADDGVGGCIAASTEIAEPVAAAHVVLEIPEGRDGGAWKVEGLVGGYRALDPLTSRDRSVDQEGQPGCVTRKRESEIAQELALSLRVVLQIRQRDREHAGRGRHIGPRRNRVADRVHGSGRGGIGQDQGMGGRRKEQEERQRQHANQPAPSGSHRCAASLT